MIDLRFGDCLTALRAMPDEFVDAIVTDPPYGLADHKPATVVAALTAWANGDRERVPDGRGFMGRSWDTFVPPPAVWDECLRVLKPGGHLLTFAGARTADLMGLSVRMAGFEIRDTIMWVYGSGFPKGIDVGKAIEQWNGWNTALKPAHEPIIVARKPFPGTVAGNVVEHGTGALNIGACRVAHSGHAGNMSVGLAGRTGGVMGKPAMRRRETTAASTAGRWPANVVFTHTSDCAAACEPGCPVAELDTQSGMRPPGSFPARTGRREVFGRFDGYADPAGARSMGDSGGASRFFPTFRYQAKAPTSERPTVEGKGHPTVKPRALMEWLVRLVTPVGGLLVDPFAGTGTTLQAARDEGMSAIGVEEDPLSYRLAGVRLGLDEVLVSVALACSDDELTATWERYQDVWTDGHTVAAKARQATLWRAA